MNVLLYAPPLFLVMLKALGVKGVFSALFGVALVQIILGLPFLLTYPVEYISRAFNLGHVFIHFWPVNFKFVPEEIFVSKEFACALLVFQLLLLVVFAHFRWFKKGLFRLCKSKISDALSIFSIQKFQPRESRIRPLNKEYIATVMFVGNFIGIVCARSLHYQFYSWYFYSLPFLLWKAQFPTSLRQPAYQCVLSLVLMSCYWMCAKAHFVCWCGALLEYLSFKFVLFILTTLYTFVHTVGCLDCPSEGEFVDEEPTGKKEE